jgi:hypothetical protein
MAPKASCGCTLPEAASSAAALAAAAAAAAASPPPGAADALAVSLGCRLAEADRKKEETVLARREGQPEAKGGGGAAHTCSASTRHQNPAKGPLPLPTPTRRGCLPPPLHDNLLRCHPPSAAASPNLTLTPLLWQAALCALQHLQILGQVVLRRRRRRRIRLGVRHTGGWRECRVVALRGINFLCVGGCGG